MSIKRTTEEKAKLKKPSRRPAMFGMGCLLITFLQVPRIFGTVIFFDMKIARLITYFCFFAQAAATSLRQLGQCPTTNQYACLPCPELLEARDLLKNNTFAGSAYETTYGPVEHWCLDCTNMNGLFKDFPTELTADLSCWDVSNVERMVTTFQGTDFNGTLSDGRPVYPDILTSFFDCLIR